MSFSGPTKWNGGIVSLDLEHMCKVKGQTMPKGG